MTRFVIGADVALRLAETAHPVAKRHKLLAPTLFRSQVLAALYAAAREGRLDRKAAESRLAYLRSLDIRFLGDRVLQRTAWDIAWSLDWPDTLQAEYIALTKLQADVLLTLDATLAKAARAFVAIGSIDDLA